MEKKFDPNYLEDMFSECIMNGEGHQVEYSRQAIRRVFREGIKREFFDEVHLTTDQEIENLVEKYLNCLLKIVQDRFERYGTGPKFVK